MKKPYQSRIVHIGEIPLGGHHPVRIQSMTSTPTMDTLATVEQSIRMIDAGCDYVRITAPGVKEAENLRIIKKELRDRGYTTPLIADIHYQPDAALIAARYVEKVRINPGNYVDRKKGRIQMSESEYAAELEKIRSRLKPLVDVCRQHGTAMRIGSNHGSLSERILLRYGDTPEGMVESALEFIRICEDLSYKELVISMKASNVKIMVHANRLLLSRMQELGMNFPIHLGVTEAGDAEEGRMKSAAGIAPLLWEGIGDTVRVSLTEDPEFEVPVARQLVHITRPEDKPASSIPGRNTKVTPQLVYSRRDTVPEQTIGAGNPPAVILEHGKDLVFDAEIKPDYFYDAGKQQFLSNGPAEKPATTLPMTMIRSADDLQSLPENTIAVFSAHAHGFEPANFRELFTQADDKKLANPIVLKLDMGSTDPQQVSVLATSCLSGFLVEGLADGIWLESEKVDARRLCEISFGILQATGERISKTEYIACPSCGRTLFKIQETLQQIKMRTSRLKGLKIGVMGCCVNGPGEMADAHYGYVGAGKGKITLYKGKQIMKTGIKEEFAVDELIRLIRENGDWK